MSVSFDRHRVYPGVASQRVGVSHLIARDQSEKKKLRQPVNPARLFVLAIWERAFGEELWVHLLLQHEPTLLRHIQLTRSTRY